MLSSECSIPGGFLTLQQGIGSSSSRALDRHPLSLILQDTDTCTPLQTAVRHLTPNRQIVKHSSATYSHTSQHVHDHHAVGSAFNEAYHACKVAIYTLNLPLSSKCIGQLKEAAVLIRRDLHEHFCKQNV